MLCFTVSKPYLTYCVLTLADETVRGALLACPEDVFLRMLQCPETALSGTGGKGLQHNVPSCNHAVRGCSDLDFLEQEANLRSGTDGVWPLAVVSLQAAVAPLPWGPGTAATVQGHQTAALPPTPSLLSHKGPALCFSAVCPVCIWPTRVLCNWWVIQRLTSLGCLEFLTLESSCILPLEAVCSSSVSLHLFFFPLSPRNTFAPSFHTMSMVQLQSL